MSISEDRMRKIIRNHERHAEKVAQARALKERGHSNASIASKMGTSESAVRSLLTRN